MKRRLSVYLFLLLCILNTSSAKANVYDFWNPDNLSKEYSVDECESEKIEDTRFLFRKYNDEGLFDTYAVDLYGNTMFIISNQDANFFGYKPALHTLYLYNEDFRVVIFDSSDETEHRITIEVYQDDKVVRKEEYYEYDDSGLVVDLDTPISVDDIVYDGNSGISGTGTVYKYNNVDQLTEIIRDGIRTKIKYNVQGDVVEYTNSNGYDARLLYLYDYNGELISEQVFFNDNAKPIDTSFYEYSSISNTNNDLIGYWIEYDIDDLDHEKELLVISANGYFMKAYLNKYSGLPVSDMIGECFIDDISGMIRFEGNYNGSVVKTSEEGTYVINNLSELTINGKKYKKIG